MELEDKLLNSGILLIELYKEDNKELQQKLEQAYERIRELERRLEQTQTKNFILKS